MPCHKESVPQRTAAPQPRSRGRVYFLGPHVQMALDAGFPVEEVIWMLDLPLRRLARPTVEIEETGSRTSVSITAV